MEKTEGSETSAALKLTTGKYPKEDMQRVGSLLMFKIHDVILVRLYTTQLCS
jgi:hypothetical protein